MPVHDLPVHDPSVHDLSRGDDVLARVAGVARRALRHYGVPPTARVTLINVSENATFTVEHAGTVVILRVHRLGYHSAEAIGSELDWLTALREEAGVRTPAVIRALDGSRIVTVEDPGSPPRSCVMFEYVPGAEPPQDRLVEHFEPLGAITARMHLHSLGWERPAAFTRFAWDDDAAFGPAPRWGRWQDGAGVDAEARAVLSRLEREVRDRLARFGRGPERFGLIHADLRLANLLVGAPDGARDVDAAGGADAVPGGAGGEGGTTVIDFDDCGLGWFLYDLGAAVSFIEHHPLVPQMIGAWARGYRTVRDLPPDDEREIWTFIMLRRLLLVAWIGSHPAVDVARELGAGYTQGSCELAERFLSGSL